MPRYMGGARGSLLAGLTTNTIPKVSGLSLVDSLLSDDGTNVTLASGQLFLPAGSAGAPALTGTDADTGILFPAGNAIDFSMGGTAFVRFNDGVGINLGAGIYLTWGSATSPTGAADLILQRAAAATPYFYGSSTAVGATLRLGNTNVGYEDFARNTEAHTLAAAGTSTTATAVWPANSGSQALTARITTEITGCTSVQVGVAGDVTRYGTFNTLTAGQTIAIGRIDNYAAETGVLFTAVGGGASFTAGVVRVNLRYVTASAPTS